jgi:ketosteroid isomerase-like protein
MDNITAVQEIYAAFGRGDVPGILDRLAPDVVFDPDFDGTAPWLTRREGRDGVAGFFADLAALDIHAFEPRNFMAGGDQVAVTIRIGATVRATGEALPSDEMHLWTFGPDGLATEMRHYVDTAKHAAAALVHH